MKYFQNEDTFECMAKLRRKGNHLVLLVVITATALSGIIAMQVYWLRTSYQQQQSRFTADVQNSLTMVTVKYQLTGLSSDDSIFKETPDTYSGYAKKLTKSLSSLKSSIQYKNNIVSISISDSANQPNAKHELPSTTAASQDSPSLFKGNMDTLLHTYRKSMKTELLNRAINIPFELAIKDNHSHIITATCDSSRFNDIPVASTQQPLDIGNISNSYTLQVAFPNANIYLLRRMTIILSVTILLIIICTYSFTYMLIRFFRQKKIADIRNDFMNNMTHELKTPISAALVAVEMIEGKRRPLEEATKKEYLGIAKGELARLSLLTDRVLKMAAFDNSDVVIHKTRFDVQSLLLEIINLMRPIFDTEGAIVNVTIVPDKLTIIADRDHLLNVFQNLFENAIKYNDKAIPEISIDIRVHEHKIKIMVIDNGMGIPAAYTKKVFDKFFRVPTGDRHDIKGYGLGLSYVKAIIALHTGNIILQSKEKEGTTFTITLPDK